MTNYERMTARAKEMTLEQLEDAKFMNNMIDRWSSEDYAWDTILFNEIMARKKAQKN